MKKLILVTLITVAFSLVGCSQGSNTKVAATPSNPDEPGRIVIELNEKPTEDQPAQTEVVEAEPVENWEKHEGLPEVQAVDVRILEETIGTTTTEIPVVAGDYFLQVDDLVYNLMEEKTPEEIIEQINNSEQKEIFQISEWNPSKLIPAGDIFNIKVTKYGVDYLTFYFTNNSKEPVEAKELTTAFPTNFNPLNSAGEDKEILKKRLQSCYISGGVCLDGEGLTYSNIPEKLEQYGFKKSEANYTPNPGYYKLETKNSMYYEANVVLYDELKDMLNSNGDVVKQQYEALSIRFYIDADTQECYLITIDKSVVPLEVRPDATYTLK